MQCVDSSANLPRLCSSGQLYDCSEIQWNVNGQRIVFDICDSNDKTYYRTAFMISYQCISYVFTDYGFPCQKPISGFMRTVNGNCDRRAALQGIKLCEEGPDGRDECTSTAISSSGSYVYS